MSKSRQLVRWTQSSQPLTSAVEKRKTPTINITSNIRNQQRGSLCVRQAHIICLFRNKVRWLIRLFFFSFLMSYPPVPCQVNSRVLRYAKDLTIFSCFLVFHPKKSTECPNVSFCIISRRHFSAIMFSFVSSQEDNWVLQCFLLYHL